ncbi:MAG TPA: 5,6-dimethylbenzimidazole synthase [Acidimicrobiales bacterium]|nr:5,6-dimethylbenzimidazole synthase [Acidimicrobiales bacterium]
MTWQRPVPVVGDTTSAKARRDDPRAWAFDADDRDALYAVILGRRDIRRFRPDPLDAALLERILGAAHAAPSVGHSQPWRFVVVQDASMRDRAALLADREWHRQAAELSDQSGRHMLDLQLHGIRDAPVGVVVCCDRRAPARGVLGRATYVDADLWSCACAIENLWLAARAEGVGAGWVTLFRPDELATLVGLPKDVETLGWLCLGWPDERPPEPGLQRAGWSTRQPLSDVVVWNRWPREPGEADAGESAPAPPASHLAAPAPASVVAARDQTDVLLTPPGSLGALDRALDRLVSLELGPATPASFVLAAAGHPVARRGVSTYDDAVTREVLAATVAGESLGAVTARLVGASVLAVDAGVPGPPVAGALACRPGGPRGDLVDADAMAIADAERLVAAGRASARGLGRRIVALGEVGIGNTTVAAALVASRLGLAAADAVGLGAGGDAATLDRKRAVVVAALDRAARTHRELSDPVAALAALGGPEIAYLSGVTIGAAEAGSLVVLDGLVTSAAALVAVALEPAVAAHLVAGQESRERAHRAVNAALGVEPLLSLRLRAGEGVGALFAVQLLRTGATLRAETGRVQE